MNAALNDRLEEVARSLEHAGREDDAARLRALRGRAKHELQAALAELLHLEPASAKVRERARAAERALRRAA